MQLSYSSLSILKECPRCFYLDRKLGITRPRGIKSSMPENIDKILKEQMQKYNGSLPPVLKAVPELEGFVIYDHPEVKKMGHWKSNPLKMQDAKGNVIVGAFDALLHNPEKNLFAYLDYKSTGKEPAPDFGARYYQSQCDIYTNFLVCDKRAVADFGVLLFFWPSKADGGLLSFGSTVTILKPNPMAAEKTFKEAIVLLEGPIPPSGAECEHCLYVKNART